MPTASPRRPTASRRTRVPAPTARGRAARARSPRPRRRARVRGRRAAPTIRSMMPVGIVRLAISPAVDRAPVAQDRDAVGEREQLAHPVRDEDRRHAARLERADELEERLDLRLGERAGRLVEQQHARVHRDRARDLDELLLVGPAGRRPGRRPRTPPRAASGTRPRAGGSRASRSRTSAAPCAGRAGCSRRRESSGTSVVSCVTVAIPDGERARRVAEPDRRAVEHDRRPRRARPGRRGCSAASTSRSRSRPTRLCTSPRRTARSAPRSAWTPPKRLWIPVTLRSAPSLATAGQLRPDASRTYAA